MNAALAALAGFGLFFIGVRLIGEHLHQLATRRIRQRIGRAVSAFGVAPLTGFTLGALIQSTSGVTFVVMSLLTSGMVQMSQAMSMIGWANLGTAVLVILSSINLQSLALVLFGLCGISFFQGYDKIAGLNHPIYSVFGIALLFLGLSFIKDGLESTRGNPWIAEFIAFASENGGIAFAVGTAAAMAMQSSATVAIISLPLVSSGILPEAQVALIVYGANVGSGIATMLLSSNVENSARQLGLLTAVLKLLAAVFFILLYLLEHYSHIPLVLALSSYLTSEAGMRVALIYLMFQLGAAVIGEVARTPMQRLLGVMAPASEYEGLARPHYIFEEAICDPNAALNLVDLELARMVEALHSFLDEVRSESENTPIAVLAAERHHGARAICSEVELFLSDLALANPNYDGAEGIFEARLRLRTLMVLQDCLADFIGQIAKLPEGADTSLKHSMVEALHLLLQLVADASRACDPLDMVLLGNLCGDRSDLLEGIRRKLVNDPAPTHVRDSYLLAMMLFERVTWQVRELVSAFQSTWEPKGNEDLALELSV